MDIQTALAFQHRFDEVTEGLLAPTPEEWKTEMSLDSQLSYVQAVALVQIARRLEHILHCMQTSE